jgi:AraC-like DNA-binding protein
MNREEFITRKPNNPFLQQYISYYYFHNSLGNYESNKYIYYPNIKNALTIYKNSKVIFYEKYSRTEPDTKTGFSFLYSGIQKQLRTSEIIAPFDKIGIVFNELGINHFIKQPLSSLTSNTIDKHFDYFGKDFVSSCKSIYSTKELDEKINLLDIFFESKFYDFQDKKFKDCMNTIISSKQKLTVSEVSEQLQINRKTLLRLFKKHLCCTTKEYLNIAQFRKSLNEYLLINKNQSFTELAIGSQYYDQSQFINHFKKLSGENPKTFFKNIKHLGNEDTFWTFQ